jgi:DNA-binding MarR family transcriptional regulator
MGPDLEKALMSSVCVCGRSELCEDQNPRAPTGESLICQQLLEQGPLPVSQIAQVWPDISESTISITLTKLWKQKLVSKTISPENQRVTQVDLTDKGRAEMAKIFEQRRLRFQIFFDAIQVTPEKEVLVRIFSGVTFLDQV